MWFFHCCSDIVPWSWLLLLWLSLVMTWGKLYAPKMATAIFVDLDTLSEPWRFFHQKAESNSSPLEYGQAFVNRIWQKGCCIPYEARSWKEIGFLFWNMCLGNPEPTCEKSSSAETATLQGPHRNKGSQGAPWPSLQLHESSQDQLQGMTRDSSDDSGPQALSCPNWHHVEQRICLHKAQPILHVHEKINCYCFKPLRFGVICYMAVVLGRHQYAVIRLLSLFLVRP